MEMSWWQRRGMESENEERSRGRKVVAFLNGKSFVKLRGERERGEGGGEVGENWCE